ncbi:HU family DNA-binding protein [Paenibacillus cremeus]|uniref:HU family DNA-binding protein n=1 Tax=Paenibacillus cremeus TaxID=2163881 RepID=A0A559KCU3_9BACL|nr:HU family DNA-binding protein [Paenibacillus cremeus]TVY09952.1 hypothetical protein FPZ49_11315 [Paenibacillus cremeus]
MKKEDLILKFAGKTGHSKKDATVCVDAFLDCIVEGLDEDGVVDITKVLKLTVKETSARKGRNPQTGEEIEIPKGKKIAFKALKRLDEVVGK